MSSLVKYGRLLQFADDTTLICLVDAQDEVQLQLEYDLGLFCFWLHSSKMKLNIAKSSLMWFRSKWGASAHPFVFIDDHQLQEVEEQKYLGVVFDKLQWGPQVNYICKKASYLYPLKVSDIWYSEDACRIIDSIMIWLCTSSLGDSSAGVLGILISKLTKQNHLGYQIPSQIWPYFHAP